jgi:hypothetical protein
MPYVGRQIPFAMSKAINDTLREVQQWTVSEYLPSRFTLRAKGAPWQRPGNKFGFNLRFANKTNLTGTLGSQAPWLKLQEEGGTKSVTGHRVAVPTTELKSPQELVSREKKPRRILKTGKGFESTPFVGKGKMRPGIYVRVGGAIKALYGFFSSTKVPKRMSFEKDAGARARLLYPANFRRALDFAITSAGLKQLRT